MLAALTLRLHRKVAHTATAPAMQDGRSEADVDVVI
jgi:hypothetical protein